MPLPSGIQSTATIKVAIRAKNCAYSRPQIVHDSYSSHAKEKTPFCCHRLNETGVTMERILSLSNFQLLISWRLGMIENFF